MLIDVSLALISDWATTLSLIFGGCCRRVLVPPLKVVLSG